MNSNKKKDADPASFEEDLETLEAIVNTLETGKLPLNEALRQFESGVALVRKCEKTLNDAERKIEILMKGMNGEMEAQPFEESADAEPLAVEPAMSRKPVSRKPASDKKPLEGGPSPDADFPEPPPEDDDDSNELF